MVPRRIPWTLSLCLLLATPAQLFAHGGDYKGPAGQVPPSGREPGDPTPPPTPTPGPTPGGPGGPGGVTPNGPNVAPGPGGLTPGPRAGGPGPTGSGLPGSATPGPRRRKSSIEGFERWEFWWGYNRDRFLKLKSMIHRSGLSTESASFFLGNGNRNNVSNTVAPTEKVIREKLVPVLIEAMDDSFFDVRAAAVIALGKTGTKSEIPTILRGFKDDNKQVRESTALALGILGDSDAIPQLVEILNDTPEGKRILGRSKILTRTRAFAAIALGLIGRNDSQRSDDALQPLLKTLNRKEASTNVPVSALSAIGIMQAREAIPAVLQIAMNPREDVTIRAQAVIALGKIGDSSVLPSIQRLVRDKEVQVMRSSVIALGLLADATDELSMKILQNQAERGRDVQAKNWALISLGQIGGAPAKKTLRRSLEAGQKSTKAFAALGLGILARDTGDMEAARHIHETFKKLKGDSARAGLAIALGLMRFAPAKTDLLELMSGKGDPDLRGYCAVALGLMGARGAISEINKALDTKIDPNFQRSAATALGLMGDRGVISRLTKIVRTAKTEYAISSAALALGVIGDVTSIDPLIDTAQAKHGVVDLARANAVTALGIVGDLRPLPALHVFSMNNNYRCLVDALNELLTIL